MKIFMTLMILSIAPSVFAEGAWNLSCVSAKGVSFNASNGHSEIQTNSKIAHVEIENYDLGLSSSKNKVKWIGSPIIISESVDNSCNSDQAITVFKQKVKITLAGKTSEAEVICTDSVTTSSGAAAESNECVDAQI